jgi:hypothetical protein
MALSLRSVVFQFVDSNGRPYAGGSLTFYESGTSTPLDTYSDVALSTPNTNPVALNSAGWPETNIFLQNVLYRVVLKDSSGNTIWVRDDIASTDLASVMILKVGSGNPNGNVAGTAGSSGVLPTGYWDYTNAIEYRCTTTGNAATAVWTALNASSAIPTVIAPQGYLTATSGTPIITSDVVAGTAVYYTPFVGNLVPIYNGSSMIPTTFTELTLTLVAQHLASQIYDVFVFSDDGVPTLVTGPAWTTPTAGSGARGTGSSTTELTRLNGYWVNAVQISARNGSTTYTIAANQATYVGSIFMDGTNGQLTCHRSWGQSRKWGIWNAYNRQPLYLKAGDSTASWNYNTATIRASNNAAANSLTVFSGLPEEWFDLEFRQFVTIETTASGRANTGIGWNSTTAMSGRFGNAYAVTDADSAGSDAVASYLQVPSLGINVVTALENAVDTADTNMTWFGGEDDMVLSAKWRG